MKESQTFIYKDWQLDSLNEYINAISINTNDINYICDSVIFVSYEFFQTSTTINKITQNNNTIILAADIDAVLMMLDVTPDNVFQLIDGKLLNNKKKTLRIDNDFMSLSDTIDAGKKIDIHNRDRLFFTLIGRHDSHRDILVNTLYQSKLMHKGTVIYHDHRNLDSAVSNILAKQCTGDKFTKNFNNPESNAEWHDATPQREYYETYNLEIVTETTVNAHFLTEKTIKPIASRMPFLILSSPGYLKYLRNIGYKTFSGVFDESYDNITATIPRVQAITSTLNTLISTNQIHNLTNTCSAILEHNALHAQEIALKHSSNKRNSIKRMLSNITK